MPSILILHYPGPPSEPSAAALTISYNDSNLQGKSSATNSRISASSKAGDIAQHSKVGRRLCGMDICAMIPVSEEQEYLGLALKMGLTAELVKEAFNLFPSALTGKVLTPTSHNINMWGIVASSPAAPFCTLNFGNSLAHLHSLLVPYKWRTAQCAPHHCLYTSSDLCSTGASFFCMNVCNLGTFL